MGFFSNNDKERAAVTGKGVTTIAQGTKIEGVMFIECNLQIDGEFEGEIYSKASVVVGESANFKGKIITDHLICSGKVSGKIIVNDLDILNQGFIEGEISYSTVRIDQGGVLEGTTTRVANVKKLTELENKTPNTSDETKEKDIYLTEEA